MWIPLTLALLSAAPVEYPLDPRSPGLGDALEFQVEPAVMASPAPFVAWADFRPPLLGPDVFMLNALDGGLSRLARQGDQRRPVLAGLPDGGAVLAFEESDGVTRLSGVTVIRAEGLTGNREEVQLDGLAPTLATGPMGEVFLAFVDRGVPTVSRVDDLFTDGGVLYRDLAYAATGLRVQTTALSVSGSRRVLALETRDATSPLSPQVRLYAALDGSWNLSEVLLTGAGVGLESPRVLATSEGVWCAAWDARNRVTHLFRQRPGQMLESNTSLQLREVSLLDVGGESRVIGVGAMGTIESSSADATFMGLPGMPTVHFQRPQTQPRQDQLVVAQSPGQYLFAWTWGATVRNVSAARVTVSQPNPPLLATSRENQQEVKVTSVGGKTLAVWRVSRTMLRLTWVGEPGAAVEELTLSANDLTDFSVASNDAFAVVAWREGASLKWVRFSPGGTGTPQSPVLVGADHLRVVSDGRVFWLTGLSTTGVVVQSLGDGVAAPTGIPQVEPVSDSRPLRFWASSCLDNACVVAWVRGAVGASADLQWFTFPAREGGQLPGVAGPIAASNDGTDLQVFWHDTRTLKVGVPASGGLQRVMTVQTNLPALSTLDVSPRPPVLVALGFKDRTWSFPLATPDVTREDMGALMPTIVGTLDAGALGYHRYEVPTDSSKAFVLLWSHEEPDGGRDAGTANDAGVDAGSGEVDAGLTGPDAGVEPFIASGCPGCSSFGAQWVVLAVVWALRRRKANR